MKFKIVAEVEIDDESSHLPVTCDAESRKSEGEKVISDIVSILINLNVDLVKTQN